MIGFLMSYVLCIMQESMLPVKLCSNNLGAFKKMLLAICVNLSLA